MSKRADLSLLAVVIGCTLAAQAETPRAGPPEITETELGRLLFWDPILSGEGVPENARRAQPDTGSGRFRFRS